MLRIRIFIFVLLSQVLSQGCFAQNWVFDFASSYLGSAKQLYYAGNSLGSFPQGTTVTDSIGLYSTASTGSLGIDSVRFGTYSIYTITSDSNNLTADSDTFWVKFTFSSSAVASSSDTLIVNGSFSNADLEVPVSHEILYKAPENLTATGTADRINVTWNHPYVIDGNSVTNGDFTQDSDTSTWVRTHPGDNEAYVEEGRLKVIKTGSSNFPGRKQYVTGLDSGSYYLFTIDGEMGSAVSLTPYLTTGSGTVYKGINHTTGDALIWHVFQAIDDTLSLTLNAYIPTAGNYCFYDNPTVRKITEPALLLTWVDIAEDSLSLYIDSLLTVQKQNVWDTSYTDVLAQDEERWYRVRFQDTSFIYSEYSNIDSGSVPGLNLPVLNAPYGLYAENAGANINAYWSHINSSGVQFKIYRSSNNVDFDSIGITSFKNYSDPVGYNVERYYKVSAYRSLDDSSSTYSNVDSATTESTNPVVANIYVKSTGNDVDDEFDTYAYNSSVGVTVSSLNANMSKLKPGYVVNFEGTLSNDILNVTCSGTADSNIIFRTREEYSQATLGDFNISNSTATIIINGEYITITNLMVKHYRGAANAIAYYKGGFTISDCIISGNDNSHLYGGNGIASLASGFTKQITITNNTIHDFNNGMLITSPNNLEISYNEIYNIYRYNGYENHGGMALKFSGGGLDTEYNLHIHHNEIYNFEHSAMYTGQLARVLIEYNYIHSNLDERIFMGGIKHGTVGKMYDNSNQYVGGIGTIFRYNYVDNLRTFGRPGYTYTQGTPEEIEAGIIHVEYTGTGSLPVYITIKDGSWSLSQDAVISGLGYCNMWVHNNVFSNIDKRVFNRGYSTEYSTAGGTSVPFNANYTTYFVNNTTYQTGETFVADYGIIMSSTNPQSPTYFYNNILDVSKLDNTTVFYSQYSYDYIDYNIFPNFSKVKLGTETASGTGYAIYVKDGKTTVPGSNNSYATNPQWLDTTSTIFAPNIGVSGAYIPDLRIDDGGNASNTGLDYDLLGDNYTILGQTHTLGEDPEGRSFAYDILGNLRSTNDIGAVGSGSDLPSLTGLNYTNKTDTSVTLRAALNIGGTSASHYTGVYVQIKHADSSAYDSTSMGTYNSSQTISTGTIIYDVFGSLAEGTWSYKFSGSNSYGYAVSSVSTFNILTGSEATYTIDTVTIAGSLYDAYLHPNNTTVNVTGTYMRLGDDEKYDLGLIFQNVNERAGKTLISATIEIVPQLSATSDIIFSLYGEETASPTTFTTDKTTWLARVANITTNYVTHNVVDDTPNDVYVGFDVLDVMEEMFATYTYDGDDNLCVFAKAGAGTVDVYKAFHTYESNPAYAARLILTYED